MGGVAALSISSFSDCSGLAGKEKLLLAAATSPGEDRNASASAHVEFSREFAPGEMCVKALEKPFRDEFCLNGRWQFQPVALTSNFRQGIDPAPELPLPNHDGWEQTPIKIPSPWNVNSFADAKGQGGDFRNYPSYPAAWQDVELGWLRRPHDCSC